MENNKIRTIITQDAEVDDQNSLRHFLLYANEVEVQGIVQSSSKFHWIGVEGADASKVKRSAFEFEGTVTGDYSKPYRWPGTDWMMKVLDDYEKDYVNLQKHAEGYPSPDALRAVTKVGNIGYEGEMDHPTDGSELIRKHILDDDPRTLYVQVWGGTNTLARALLDIQNMYENTAEWPALREKIMKKVVITACGEQDPTYRNYIAENWPDMQFVKTLQMKSYAYPWFVMPEGESKDTLRAAFMKSEILNGKSALAAGYCTWLDGKVYEGEGPDGQFGSNPEITKTWFGARMGLPPAEPFDFLSEGDSPTFFLLFPCWGFRTLEDFSWGGIAGRYHKVSDQYNSKGEPLNVWDVSVDGYKDRDGQIHELESMWPYVADIQRDFAARVDWCSKTSYEQAEHAPKLEIKEGLNLTAKPGETLSIHAEAYMKPDCGVDAELPLSVSFCLYKEASAECANEAVLNCGSTAANLTIPASAKPQDRFHLVVKAQTAGHFRMVRYQQVIITVE